MAENRRGRRMVKRKKKFNPLKTFFKIVCSMVSVFMVLAGGAAFAYYKVTDQDYLQRTTYKKGQ